MNPILVFAVVVLGFLNVRAQEIPVLNGSNPSQKVRVQEIAAHIRPGQIVLMGENHGVRSAQQAQLELLNALRRAGRKVSVGLEFFYYPDQPAVSAYREGQLAESEFLKTIQWTPPPYEFYRPQALFPRLEFGEQTLAINAPRTLTGKIAKQGLSSLTAEERSWMPPNFELGRESYRQRFLAQMPHLPNPEVGDRYFAAQSTWDDTMAWKVSQFAEAHPDQVVVVTVGDFHVQYQDGLPARVLRRSGQKPLVFSFVNAAGLSPEELRAELDPASAYGVRADFIWLASEASK